MSEVTNVYELVEVQEQSFNQVLVCDEVNWSQESQFAKQLLQQNDFLNKTAWGNPNSLANAIINVASIGISLNPATKHAYLVPRDKMVCLDISYMGLLHLAQQSGSIRWGQTRIVYANDSYENAGIDKAPNHSYNAFGDRGDPVGVYCTVKTADGDYLTEEMNKAQVYEIRQRSKAFTSGKTCPWKTDELEMWRKTVVKRAYKYWPKNDRLNTAIDVLNQHEGLREEKEINPGFQAAADSIDVDQANELLHLIESAGMKETEFCNHKKINVVSVYDFPVARFEGCKKWLNSIIEKRAQQ